MELTPERMESGDALFFYQLMVPMCDPSKSGVHRDPRMSFYDDVAKHTNIYAINNKNCGGTYGHKFRNTTAEELVNWDGIVARNRNKDVGNSWMSSEENEYDPLIYETMSFSRWRDLKYCMKLCCPIMEKMLPNRKQPGFDPSRKFRLIWDVLTHNMNCIVKRGGLDITLDKTTWPNASYADCQGKLRGKKVERGGQNILVLDSVRRYMYAWSPRHKFFTRKKPFTARGSG